MTVKFELSEKTAQRLIDALEDEIIILQNKVSSLEEILSEINVLKRSLGEKDAEIALLKEEKKAFIQSLSGNGNIASKNDILRLYSYTPVATPPT